MKAFTRRYDYVHGANGIRYQGTIEADTARELVQLMQDELDASGGALTPATFMLAGQVVLTVRVDPPVVVLDRRLRYANERLKTAGLPEVTEDTVVPR